MIRNIVTRNNFNLSLMNRFTSSAMHSMTFIKIISKSKAGARFASSWSCQMIWCQKQNSLSNTDLVIWDTCIFCFWDKFIKKEKSSSKWRVDGYFNEYDRLWSINEKIIWNYMVYVKSKHLMKHSLSIKYFQFLANFLSPVLGS